jgi:hypothetical protein
MNLTNIKDIDNLIYQWVRNLQPIDISELNNQIKNISIDNRVIFNFIERIIYYDTKQKKVIMPCCCTKCGNYMNRGIQYTKILCKCNQEEQEKEGDLNFKKKICGNYNSLF